MRTRFKSTRAAVVAVAMLGCTGAGVPGEPMAVLPRESAAAKSAPVDIATNSIEEGLISWYGASFHDQPTASGERFDSNALTMAHPHLPFGTQVRVTNLRNGRSVVLRVNDRGPHVGKRIGDVSAAAAHTLGMVRRGVVRARLEILGQ